MLVQSTNKKNWLLSNALFVALAIMGVMRKDHAHQTYVIAPLKCGEFD
jgi:aconitase A